MRGFTFIETIIYIALLGLLMTGVLMASYNLVLNSETDATKTSVQNEGSFVERKLIWAMQGMTIAPSVGGSGCNGTVSFTRSGAKNPIEFQRNTSNNSIEMREGGVGSYLPITTSAVSATCFTVSTIPAVGTGPSGVSVDSTLTRPGNTKTYDFPVTQYLRQ